MPRFKNRLIDKDLGWKKMMVAAEAFKRGIGKIEVGVLAGTPQGDARVEGSDLKRHELAIVLERGSDDGRIPARPVLARTFDAKREQIKALSGALFAKILTGEVSITRALNTVGFYIVGEIKSYILRAPGPPPPNAPSTVRRKGFDHPWLDTGTLAESFSWRGPGGIGPK